VYYIPLFFWNQTLFDLDDESICQPVTFLPFFYSHKYHAHYFDEIIPKYLVDIFFDHIYLWFLAVLVYYDEIHFQVDIEFLSEIVLIDHNLIGREEGDDFILKSKEEDIFEGIIKFWFDWDGPALFIFDNIDNICFIQRIYLFLDCRKRPNDLAFQGSHRDSLPFEEKIFEDIHFRLTAEEFL